MTERLKEAAQLRKRLTRDLLMKRHLYPDKNAEIDAMIAEAFQSVAQRALRDAADALGEVTIYVSDGDRPDAISIRVAQAWLRARADALTLQE